MARYERIMQQRSTEAVIGRKDKVTGLMETIYRASQGIQEKTDRLLELYNGISASQSRQQTVVICLTVVLAISTALYTWITWQSVAAMRESNEIQRQLLQLQEASAPVQVLRATHSARRGKTRTLGRSNVRRHGKAPRL
jgi:hypothetical protein